MLGLILVKVGEQISFNAALAATTVALAKGAGEGLGLGWVRRFGELGLRRGFEVVMSWIWEVWIKSWEMLVGGGPSIGGIAKEPRVVVRLLHGDQCQRASFGRMLNLDQLASGGTHDHESAPRP